MALTKQKKIMLWVLAAIICLIVLFLLAKSYVNDQVNKQIVKYRIETQTQQPAVVPPAKNEGQSKLDSLIQMNIDLRQMVYECAKGKTYKPVIKKNVYIPYVSKFPNVQNRIVYDAPPQNTTTQRKGNIVSNESSSPSSLSPIFFENGSKKVKFCVRLGQNEGRHLPHLAMLDGDNFDNSEDNTKSGFNWSVTPTDGYSGLYGVTKSGTFYVAASIIEKYLESSDNGIVELKSTATGWSAKKMYKENGYYIFKKN